MTVIGNHFGRKTMWVYADTKEPVEGMAPHACPKCGKNQTEEGYDPCIGFLQDDTIVATCCGHGIYPPYVVFSDGSRVDGWANIIPLLPEQLQKQYREIWT